jgi:hypothetical protein
MNAAYKQYQQVFLLGSRGIEKLYERKDTAVTRRRLRLLPAKS